MEEKDCSLFFISIVVVHSGLRLIMLLGEKASENVAQRTPISMFLLLPLLKLSTE